MKKTSILFATIVMASLLSCTKDEAAKTQDVSAEGKWIYDTYTYTNTQKNYTGSAQPASDPNCETKSYFTLNTGGQLELGTVISSFSPTDPCMLKKIQGTWKIEDKTLKLYRGDQLEAYPIVELTATTLSFKLIDPTSPDIFYTYNMKRSN